MARVLSASLTPTWELTLVSGSFFLLRGKCGKVFAVSGTLAFPVSVAALISFIALYFYELPTHHCPFCILQGEYGYIGYPLYLALLGGTVSGMGVGLLMPFRKIKSLSEVLPRIQRKLAIISSILFAVFAVLVIYGIVFSGLILEG